jgi:hypothetical protein
MRLYPPKMTLRELMAVNAFLALLLGATFEANRVRQRWMDLRHMAKAHANQEQFWLRCARQLEKEATGNDYSKDVKECIIAAKLARNKAAHHHYLKREYLRRW